MWVHNSEMDKEFKAGETMVIPAHVPHLYKFMEDTLMTEVWRHPRTHLPCKFKAWYYKPFRDRIASASLAKTDRAHDTDASPEETADAVEKQLH